MTVDRAIRWWPPAGVLAMLLLGWMVGNGSTLVDDEFLQVAHDMVGQRPNWLLIFTDWWLLGLVLGICIGVALYRRQWRLALVVAACPFAAIGINAAFKRVFVRHNGPYLEYPSGHTTLVVVVMGMLVLVAGCRLWAVTVAVVISLLGILGLIVCGYHYLTDTIGAVLLTTALVCIAARLARCVASARMVNPPQR